MAFFCCGAVWPSARPARHLDRTGGDGNRRSYGNGRSERGAHGSGFYRDTERRPDRYSGATHCCPNNSMHSERAPWAASARWPRNPICLARVLANKDALTATGRSTEGDWVAVQPSNGTAGWVASNFVNCEGEISSLPETTPAAPPLPGATSTP